MASTVSPLPASNYGVRAVCAASAPRQAQCLSRQLVPRTAAARARTHPLGMPHTGPLPARSPAAGDFGLRPQDLHSAYQLPAASGTTQTIAIVDAYNDPSAEADLAEYSQEFGLPSCTTANGCFQKLYASGVAPFPKTIAELEKARKGTVAEREKAQLAEGWALEISLDIEVAHAICQSCRVLLVEASTPSFEDLELAEEVATASGATEISNSWGGSEAGETPAFESSSPFNHPGLVITASAGDNGYRNWDIEGPAEPYTEFPASSPHVVAVGGTRLSLGAGGVWTGESVWNGSGAGGGGCSEQLTSPPWQQSVADFSSVGCGQLRAVADVSADADPYTGVAVHDSNTQCQETIEGHVVHWCTIGGTSLASPLIAAVFALAGGAAGVDYPARTLYENGVRSPASLHDVVNGSNGACSKGFDPTTGISACTPAEEAQTSCASQLICLAAPGYDGPSGVGTPHGIGAFQPAPGGEEPRGASTVPPPSPAPVVPPQETPPGAGASGSPPTGPPAPPTAPQIVISRLTLTPNAIFSLNHGRARLSQVGFAFVINRPARVRVTLARRVSVHGRTRWQTLPGALTLAAPSGRNRRHLTGHGILAGGLYRLTLAPASGAARSLVFHVR